uniref:Uncharacterized protein n=1 Tax=Panagrellus redivivus TaxID=6233 RepID=A0A7E4V1P2_PANRE
MISVEDLMRRFLAGSDIFYCATSPKLPPKHRFYLSFVDCDAEALTPKNQKRSRISEVLYLYLSILRHCNCNVALKNTSKQAQRPKVPSQGSFLFIYLIKPTSVDGP